MIALKYAGPVLYQSEGDLWQRMLMNATPTPDEQDIKSALEQLSKDERNWMPKEINQWAMYPRKTSSSPLPESLKIEVTTKANELIENVLKPKYIQPPPENPQFNYIVDIYGKWYHKAFYFCAEYRVAGPNPTVPSFEVKFARMQYAGNRRFHLSYMRHTGQWIQIYTDLTVDECIESVRDDPYFTI